MRRVRQFVAAAVNIPILYKTGIFSRYKVLHLLEVTDKNQHCAKLSIPVFVQHESPCKFSTYLHVDFSALHPDYCLLQAPFAHVLHSFTGRNSSPSKFCKHSETCFSAEHSDPAITAGSLLPQCSHFHYKNCIHNASWNIHL